MQQVSTVHNPPFSILSNLLKKSTKRLIKIPFWVYFRLRPLTKVGSGSDTRSMGSGWVGFFRLDLNSREAAPFRITIMTQDEISDTLLPLIPTS